MVSSFLFRSTEPLPLDEIRAHLGALPTARRDRWDDAVFIVADDPATLRSAIDAREKSQLGFPRVVAVVRLYDARVDFAVDTLEVETVRAFARWLRSTYDLAILDEHFQDLTSEVDENLDYLFGKPTRT